MAVVGVDIGGTKIKACLQDHTNTVSPHVELPTPQAGAQAIITAIGNACEQLIADSAYPVRAIGIGSTGLVDPVRGRVVASTGHIPGWQDVAVTGPLALRLGVPVYIANDVNAFALGEMASGAGRGHQSALCVAVGTGVGGALVFNNDLWTGRNYLAGEAGYLFAGFDGDKMTILEHCAGGRGLESTYQQRTGASERISLKDISRRAQEDNDANAKAVITAGAHILGSVLGTVLTFFDPDVCIIGGGVPNIGPLWQEPFVAGMQAAPLHNTDTAPIKWAELGTNAVMLGAAALAWKSLGVTPSP